MEVVAAERRQPRNTRRNLHADGNGYHRIGLFRPKP